MRSCTVRGTQDQDGPLKRPYGQVRQQVEAIAIRQLEIEHDGVIARFAQRIQRPADTWLALTM